MNLPFNTLKNVNAAVIRLKNFFNIKISFSGFTWATISFLPLACSVLCFLILNKEILCGSMLKAKWEMVASIIRDKAWLVNTAFNSFLIITEVQSARHWISTSWFSNTRCLWRTAATEGPRRVSSFVIKRLSNSFTRYITSSSCHEFWKVKCLGQVAWIIKP